MYKTLAVLALILSTSFASLADSTIGAAFGSTTAGYPIYGATTDQIGSHVVELGDFNGDSYKDYAISGATNKVYVVLGQKDGRTGPLDLTTASATNFFTLTLPATSVVTALASGDLNGDNILDLAIGVSGKQRVYVVYGKGSTTWTPADLAITDTALINEKGFVVTGAANSGLGDAIAIGDFTNDAKADLIIGMVGGATGSDNKGGACIVYGRANKDLAGAGVNSATLRGSDNIDCSLLTKLDRPAAVDTFEGTHIAGATAGDKLGSVVAAGADLNGDGNKDIFIASQATTKAYILYGQGAIASAAGVVVDLNSLASTKFAVVTQPGNGVITSANLVGDHNGDGKVDLALGHPDASTGSLTNNGKVYVIFGQSASFTGAVVLNTIGTNGITYTGKVDGGNFGWAVDNAGDVNSDGSVDMIVSAPFAPTARGNTGSIGKVYIFYGSKANTASVDLTSATTFRGITITGIEKTGFGASVAGIGASIGGDAGAEIIVGAPAGNKASVTDTGIVYELRGQADDVPPSTGSGFRLHASLLVLASFFVALMF